MKATKKIRVVAEIETPTVPNFLRQTNGPMLPLCAIEESGLDEIGKLWTECLKARAKEQAKTPHHFYKTANKQT